MMESIMRTTPPFHRTLTRFAFLWLLIGGLFAAPTTALADGDEPSPVRSPRVTVHINDVNVVLVVNGDRLYAFVDRVDGNEPLDGATLTVLRNGKRAPVALTEQAPGLFIGPFKRSGQNQDVFNLSLKTAAGGGERTATLVYEDTAAAKSGGSGPGRVLVIALLSGVVGAGGGVLAMRWWNRRKRRVMTSPPAPPAHAA
jgi:hypothetical protein